MSTTSAFFSRPSLVFAAAIVVRLVLLLYGRWQDASSPVKYTDIDYLVFTDAARFVSQGRSPYERATYRYTPLLSWILYPTSWGGIWFEFGKVLFVAGDIVTGLFTSLILQHQGMSVERAMKFASIWLLNPMVANISTRGSSEGLVVVIVVAMLWAGLKGRYLLASVLLGLGVHVKIYPFIYAASVFWWLDAERVGSFRRQRKDPDRPQWLENFLIWLNRGRRKLILASSGAFMGLNALMFNRNGMEFFRHTFLYHFTRIDHRHNFSVYNTVLHLNSAQGDHAAGLQIEEIAFIPQLCLSVLVIPFVLAKKDLPSTMLAQTFAFVTFNKVCTSQYFLWYMVFLPFYLPNSSLLQKPRLGLAALILWVVGQAAWLQQAYELEFVGKSTFVPGLWLTSMLFFAVNCWILGIIVDDIRSASWSASYAAPPASKQE